MQVRPGMTVLIANPGADLYGSDRMVLETVDALRGVDARVVVSVPHGGPLVDELASLGAEVVQCRAPVVRKSMLRPLGALRLLADTLAGVAPMIALLRRTKPDIVYVSTITSPLWLLLARLLRLRTVCHIHESEASASKPVLRLLNSPLFLANRLLINSKFSLSTLNSVYPRLAARTTIVYNAVRGPENPPEPRVVLDEPYRLLFVGRLSPRKGTDVAVRAVALLREQGIPVTLDLVGAVFPGYEWFQEQLVDDVRAQNLADAITFHGFQRDTWPYAAKADIILVPSAVDEPFGNTAVEAALAARPAVVSNIAGLKEATDGLSAVERVPAGDAEAIAAAVTSIARDWAGYRSRAIEDAAFAAMRYSAKAYADRIVSVLDGVRR